jgi:hypothetical protein
MDALVADPPSLSDPPILPYGGAAACARRAVDQVKVNFPFHPPPRLLRPPWGAPVHLQALRR